MLIYDMDVVLISHTISKYLKRLGRFYPKPFIMDGTHPKTY